MPVTPMNVNVIVLWASELRLAGKVLADAQRVIGDKAASGDDRTNAIQAALNAATVALRGCDDDGAHLIVLDP